MKAAQEKHGKGTHELQDTEISWASHRDLSLPCISWIQPPLFRRCHLLSDELVNLRFDTSRHGCICILQTNPIKARWRYSNFVVIILASYCKPEENGENYSIKKQRHPCRLWEVYWWCHWWPMSGLANIAMSFFEKKPVCPSYMCTESNPWQVMGVCACWCLHKSAFVLSSSWTYHSKGHSLWTLGQRMLHFRVVVSTVATGAVTTCKYPSFDDPWA